MFTEYNNSAITAPHIGFTLDNIPVETEIAAITSTVEEYGPTLESGMVDPNEYILKFLQSLKDSGVDTLLQEINSQLGE